jgi:hypothetical protein
MTPPFLRPMKAMKRPMPQVMATFRARGMELTIFSRTPVTERARTVSYTHLRAHETLS